VRDGDQPRRARILLLVHGMAESGHEFTRRPACADRGLASSSELSSSPGVGAPARTAAKKRPVSSVTPRKREPPPSDATTRLLTSPGGGSRRRLTVRP
jgi:hypothetical protein